MTLTAVVGLLIFFIFSAYNNHKDIVVQQQKENLSTIAQTAARNLEYFIKEKAEMINTNFNRFSYLKNPSDKTINNILLNEVDKFYMEQKKNMDSVYLVNNEGKIVYKQGIDDSKFITSYLKDEMSLFINEALQKDQASIGPVFMGNGKYFVLSIVKPIFIEGNLKSFVICTVNLDRVYEEFIAPIKVGEKGYILIKDRSNHILMYKDKEQIGMEVLADRKKMYPDLYYKDLENLIKRQMSGETGTEIYYSYWWTEKDITKVQKISAFTPVNIGDDFWVLSVQMDYEEVETPVKNNLDIILFLSFIILIILCLAVFFIMQLTKNTQSLKIETRYLKELNNTYIELQKSELKAKHFEKLQIIGTMAGGISHEFNNLLTPILGYCEIIQKEIPKGSQIGEDINEIYKIARKAADIVKQILIYGRRDTEIHKFEPLNIGLFVKESLKTVKKILPSSISVIEKIDLECGYINANSTMINQIIINISTNAYHAMKKVPGTLTIEVEKVNGKNVPQLECGNSDIYVLIKITDTGCGMDEETIVKVFEPFFTTKGVSEGTGLGLWVVHNIVLEHKGEIIVQSEKGKGSTFSIYLPWFAQNIKEQHEVQSQMKRKENIKLLLVDDDEDILKVLKKGLSQIGYKVYDESNPQSAIARFEKNPNMYDVVITDYAMPKISGAELSRIIKKVREDVKVILVTGFTEKNVDELKENYLIDDFLLKPISCEDLDIKIQLLFRNVDLNI